MPRSNMTYIKPTTLGCDSFGAKSVASARPTVCTVCKPAPTRRKEKPAAICPIHTGRASDSPCLARTSTAKGMMARPPNCTSEPCQIKGTRFHPSTDLCVSERNPINARKGAKKSGSETMIPTMEAGTPYSTIITRLRVPISSTSAIPTETWKRDKRRSLDRGNSGVAASAKGRKRAPWLNQKFVTRWPKLDIDRATPAEAATGACRNLRRLE